MLSKKDHIAMGATVAATALAGVLAYSGARPVATFAAAAVALSLLAMLIGDATEEMSTHLGPGATGVVQAALAGLPELFVCIFSLRAGLLQVVQGALIGSILANSLLVLGTAILVGGIKHGRQRFDSEPPRMIASLMLLSVSALAFPTLAAQLHTPAAAHEAALSAACAVFLLVVFVASIPFSLRSDPERTARHRVPEVASAAGGASVSAGWPVSVAILVLALSAITAGFVSEWFVGALEPAMHAIGFSQAFAGVVVVAIAGNAVENVVGIRLAAKNKPDYAVSAILNSSLQVAMCLTPVLVLLSFVLGGPVLTLVMPPLLIAALLLTTLTTAIIVNDGETIWLEGLALIGLYGIIAATFWWG